MIHRTVSGSVGFPVNGIGNTVTIIIEGDPVHINGDPFGSIQLLVDAVRNAVTIIVEGYPIPIHHASGDSVGLLIEPVIYSIVIAIESDTPHVGNRTLRGIWLLVIGVRHPIAIRVNDSNWSFRGHGRFGLSLFGCSTFPAMKNMAKVAPIGNSHKNLIRFFGPFLIGDVDRRTGMKCR